ncbi:MAG: hypothetical protein WCY06_04785 [Flavobacteriaceae bacterium]
MDKKVLVLVFLFSCCFAFSQQKILIGKVETGTMLSDILVVNLTKEIQTKTDGFGRFSIYADSGDLLIFSAIFVNRKRFLVEDRHFEKEITIQLQPQEIEIETVEIIHSDITSESLGIVPKGQKKYTQAERRLKTATDLNLDYFLLIPTLNFSLDPLINAVSGRTKKLKKGLEIERYNANLKKTYQYLSDELMINEFKIPAYYTEDFRYFLTDNSNFLKAMKTKNKDNIVSTAFSLLEEYKKTISDDQ